MRPAHIRTSTEHRRRSAANHGLEPLSCTDSTRRRSVNLSPSAAQDSGTRRLSLALNSHGDAKYGGDSPSQTQPTWKHLPGTSSPFSLSSIILRRSSLPARINHSTRILDRRRSSGLRSADPAQQELNIFRIKVLIVCFIITLVTAMLISFFRASNK